MARQSFQAVLIASDLFLSSKRSATSRIRVPRAVEDVSENREKNEFMRAVAVMELFLKDDM
jgi:hypothetical protein